MTSPVSLRVDQVARDLARDALSKFQQQELVAAETEKRRTQFERNIEDWLRRIQASYEAGQSDLSQRHSTAINTLSKNMGDMFMQQEKIIEGLTQRDVEMAQTLGRIEGKLDAFTSRFDRHEATDVSSFTTIKEALDKAETKLEGIATAQATASGGKKMLATVGAIAAALSAFVTEVLNLIFHR